MPKEKIYLLSCGKWLDRRGFLKYFEKKVLYAIRKYRMLDGAVVIKDKTWKSQVLKYFLNKIPVRNKGKGKVMAVADSTDEIAVKILETFMKGKHDDLKTLMPKVTINNKVIARPFYFMLDKEIELYAKLKGIKITKIKRDDDVRRWLDEYEQKHLELKNAIVNSLLKVENVLFSA